MALVKINEGLKEEYSMNKTFSAEYDFSCMRQIAHTDRFARVLTRACTIAQLGELIASKRQAVKLNALNLTFLARAYLTLPEGEATKLQVLGHLLQDQSLDYLMVVMFGKYYRPPENKNRIYLI